MTIIEFDYVWLRGAECVCATNKVRSEIQTARAWPLAAQHDL